MGWLLAATNFCACGGGMLLRSDLPWKPLVNIFCSLELNSGQHSMHCRLSPAVDPKTAVAPAWLALNRLPAAAHMSCKLPSSAHWEIRCCQICPKFNQARYVRTLEDRVCSHSSSSGNRDSSPLLLPHSPCGVEYKTSGIANSLCFPVVKCICPNKMASGQTTVITSHICQDHW